MHLLCRFIATSGVTDDTVEVGSLLRITLSGKNCRFFGINSSDWSATSLEMMVFIRKSSPFMALIQVRGGGQPKRRSVALIQVSELL